MNVSYDIESKSRRCSFCNKEHPVGNFCKHCIVEVEAKKGFHGYVNKPTKFLVGEKGRERVDIYPIRRRQKRMGMIDDFDFGGGMF